MFFNMYNKNNPFAKILRGELPCKKVYENEYTLAFWSIEPKAKIHILVIPKNEYIDHDDFIARATDTEIAQMHKAIIEVVKIMNLQSGYRVIVNNGKNSGQTVFHLHFHIIGGEFLKE